MEDYMHPTFASRLARACTLALSAVSIVAVVGEGPHVIVAGTGEGKRVVVKRKVVKADAGSR
jgi:hypothetical protein